MLPVAVAVAVPYNAPWRRGSFRGVGAGCYLDGCSELTSDPAVLASVQRLRPQSVSPQGVQRLPGRTSKAEFRVRRSVWRFKGGGADRFWPHAPDFTHRTPPSTVNNNLARIHFSCCTPPHPHTHVRTSTPHIGPQLRSSGYTPSRTHKRECWDQPPIQDSRPSRRRRWSPQGGSQHGRSCVRCQDNGPQRAGSKGRWSHGRHRTKRLFQSTCKPSGSGAPAAGPVPSRVLKTPAPQRALRTPGPQRVPAGSPLPLPSAQRTRRRSRASLQSHGGSPESTGSASLSFHTPAPRWEEEVSLDSIVEADVEEAELAPLEAEFEIEYAAPTAVNVPYVPAWADSIPDPVKTMQILGNMRPMFYIPPPSPPPEPELVEFLSVPLCDDNELEHPLFRKAKQPEVKSATTVAKPGHMGVKARAPLSSRTTVPARPATAAALPMRSVSAASRTVKPAVAATGSRPPIRPATVMAARPPRPATAVDRPLSSVARPMTSAARPVLKSGNMRSASASASMTRPIRVNPPPAVEDLALPDEFGLNFDLDLDVLGPDPSLVPEVNLAAPAFPPNAVPAPSPPTTPLVHAADTTDDDIAGCLASLSIMSPAVTISSPLPSVDPSASPTAECIPLRSFHS